MATKQHYRSERRDSSIERLEAQLKSGVRTLSTKTAKKYGKGKKKGDSVPLDEKDIKRIKEVIKNTHLNKTGGKL